MLVAAVRKAGLAAVPVQLMGEMLMERQQELPGQLLQVLLRQLPQLLLLAEGVLGLLLLQLQEQLLLPEKQQMPQLAQQLLMLLLAMVAGALLALHLLAVGAHLPVVPLQPPRCPSLSPLPVPLSCP